MDLLGGGGGGGSAHPPSPGQKGAGGGAIFHDKAKKILETKWDTIIWVITWWQANCEQQLQFNSNTVVKQDFAVVKQVDGRAAHMTDTTQHQSWQSTPPPPYQIMLDSSLFVKRFESLSRIWYWSGI
jgi:aconitase A